MAPKRRPSRLGTDSDSSIAAAASSSEEQQKRQKREDEEEGSDDADSRHKAAAKSDAPKHKEGAATAAEAPASDSESESSESDAKRPPSRRPYRGPDPSIKPISSKPMDGAQKSKKSSQQRTEKKKGKEPEAAEEEEAAGNGLSGKKLFQRVWTEEDEIEVLKGMIQAKNRGDDPESSLDDFLKFIHKSLHSEFTKTQLSDKIRRLKKKYATNQGRSRRGADPSFAKPHDQAVFELSKKIWGTNVAQDYGDDDMEVVHAGKEAHPNVASPRRDVGGSAVKRGSSSLVDGKHGEGRAGTLYPKLREAVAFLEGENGGSLFTGSLAEAFDLLKPETAKALEKKWDKHFMAGLKYLLERSELKEELLRFLIEALENT